MKNNNLRLYEEQKKTYFSSLFSSNSSYWLNVNVSNRIWDIEINWMMSIGYNFKPMRFTK